MDVKKTMEQAAEAGTNVREAVEDWSEKAKGTARDAGPAADLYLHEYAWTTVALVAVAAGLLGFLLGRRES
jgi:ElaB/YqjD/DUF883 family membrane-anchored ribosome-binding protein